MARVPSVAQTEQALRPFAIAARKLAVAGRCCASCGSPDIRPSNRRNALDVLLACLFLSPFRCRVCRGRFYRVWRPSLQHPGPPSAPLLMVSSGHTLLQLDSMEPHRLEPRPIPPRTNEPQLAPMPLPQMTLESSSLALAAAASGPAVSSPTGAGPVLILESDLSIRKLLRRLLERRGYFTVEISQAVDLAGELRDRRADLLIVDISATPGTGVESVVALARTYPSLKILVLSAESIKDSEIPGRLHALPKPFPLDRFVDSVDHLLGRSSAPNSAP